MSNSFARAIAEYRARAARAFQEFRAGSMSVTSCSFPSDSKAILALSSIVLSTSTPRSELKPAKSCTPYTRRVFPALKCYLEVAAMKYANFKQGVGEKPKATSCSARALGTSSRVVAEVAADVRRQRWLAYLSEARHRAFGWQPRTHSFAPVSVQPCGIPADVRQRFAARLRTLLQNARTGKNSMADRRVHAPSRCEPRRLGRWACWPGETNVPMARSPPSLQHTSRCLRSLDAGETALTREHALISTITPDEVDFLSQRAPRDTFDDMRKRYASKPDSLYRRKMSRKYAAWRRRAREALLAASRRVSDAENTMRISRGHDQLLTQRSYGERTFAPFLFDTESHAYAYSSRISDAPKLRKAMIDKYSAKKEPTVIGPDPLVKAQMAAETNPLFHTRVMNRFG